MASWSRAASALMEGFHFDGARALAARTRLQAERCHFAHYEALAEWVERTVAYRTGEAMLPDLEFVEAVAALGSRHLEALVCMTEAAVARTSGARPMALSLAERVHTIWSAMGLQSNAMLARALALACGARPRPDEIHALVAQACACNIAGVGIQTLALLRAAGASVPIEPGAVAASACRFRARSGGRPSMFSRFARASKRSVRTKG